MCREGFKKKGIKRKRQMNYREFWNLGGVALGLAVGLHS